MLRGGDEEENKWTAHLAVFMIKKQDVLSGVYL